MDFGKIDKSKKIFSEAQDLKPENKADFADHNCEMQQKKYLLENVNQQTNSDTKERQESAALYLQQAQFLTSEKRFEESIFACRKVLNLDTQIAQVYKILGDNFYGLNQTSKAISFYEKALAISPYYVEVYLKLGGVSALKEQWHKAINYYLYALAIEPQSIIAYKQLGQVYQKTNQTNLMLECWYKSLLLDSNTAAQKYYELAQKSFELQKDELAIMCCQKAINIDPELTIAYQLLAELCRGESKKELAINTYKQLLENYGDRADTNFYLAEALVSNQEWQAAIPYYRQTVTIDPEFNEAYYHFGEALIKAQEWQEAEQILNIAIKLNPECSWVHHHLGMAYFELKKWYLAQSYLQSAIELNPQFSWSYFHLAEALVQQNILERAAKVYQQFLELEPDFAYGYLRLGDILAQQVKISPTNDPDRSTKIEVALKAYQRSLELEPDRLQTYYKALQLKPKSSAWCRQLARAYVRAGQLVNGIIFYQVLLKITPDNPQFHFELAQILEQQNNLTAAVKHYQSAVNLKSVKADYVAALEKAQAELEKANGT